MTAIATRPGQGISIETMTFADQFVELVMDGVKVSVIARRLCEAFGLSWGSQRPKLIAPESGFNCVVINTVAEDGKAREMLSLPLSDAVRWINSIQLSRVKPERRAVLDAFQKGFLPAVLDRLTTQLSEKIDALRSLNRRAVMFYLAQSRAHAVAQSGLAQGASFAEIREAAPKSWSIERLAQAVADCALADPSLSLPEDMPSPRKAKPVPTVAQPDLFPEV